jgi:farnesyl diphosphate synthase
MTGSILISTLSSLVDESIDSLLPKGDDLIVQAMRYSALSSGKRIRPIILIATADIWKVEREYSVQVAAAIELIHSYSLIHDDLPAMDNDDYRRGKLSCHKKFDEATAILAGDALLTLAFEILADESSHPSADTRCKLIKIISSNIGAQGMAGGQSLDLIYERSAVASSSEILNMQYMKTSCLFKACCLMGATLGNATLKEQEYLDKYAESFGIAFQLADDLQDIEHELQNNNIVKLIGRERTKEMAQYFIKEACDNISHFGNNKAILEHLVHMITLP